MAACYSGQELNLMNATNYNLPAESFPPCPSSGAGVHCWELATANRCRAIGMTESEAVRFITDRITRPPSPANEVRTAVAKAYSNPGQSRSTSLSYSKAGNFPIPITEIKFEPLKLAATANRITLPLSWRHWLWERSPKRPETQNAYSFLTHLYREGERVHVFDAIETKQPLQTITISNSMDCRVPPLIRAGGQHGLGIWYLCNPVDGDWHDTGRLDDLRKPIFSCRNWQAVTCFRYAVFESDLAPFVQWLAFIAQIPIRVSAIYTSGGRSIHCLIRVDAGSKSEWDAKMIPLKRPLKVMGGDSGCLSAVRLSRLPGCSRPEKSGFQKLLYLCPNPPDVPLIELPVLRTRFEALDRWRNLCPRWKPNREAFQ
jgi:hypothetical protein